MQSSKKQLAINHQIISSPNYNERPLGAIIDTIVIHHTEMSDVDSAIERLCDPEAKVSCHYIVAKDGSVIQLVADNLRAWHAGESYWRGRDNINNFSIGIELDNNGNEKFTRSIMESLIVLCKELMSKYPIEQRNIVGHYDIAPSRKVDPNHHFEWAKLAGHGIGIFPNLSPIDNQILYSPGEKSLGIGILQRKLKIYGYIIDINDIFDIQTEQAVVAFKRRYCPDSFGNGTLNQWDIEADLKLEEILRVINGKS